MFQHMVSNAQIHTQELGEMYRQRDIQRQIYRQRKRWKTWHTWDWFCVLLASAGCDVTAVSQTHHQMICRPKATTSSVVNMTSSVSVNSNTGQSMRWDEQTEW